MLCNLTPYTFFVVYKFSCFEVGVAARRGLRLDTLSNLLNGNGHHLRKIFYLKVNILLVTKCVTRKYAGGHRGGRIRDIATVG